MVVCGHQHAADRSSVCSPDYGVNVNLIHQLLVNHQMGQNGGNGYLALLKFRPSRGRIEVSTYSPTLNAFDPTGAYTLPMQGQAVSPQVSTFDTDGEGWLVGDFYGMVPPTGSLTYSAIVGNPPGSVNWTQPPYHIEQWSVFVAPPKFLGDMGGYYGGTLQFDLNYTGQSQQGGVIELQDSVVLEGNVAGVPTQIRYRKDKPTDNAGWSTFTIPLIANGSTSGSGWYNITDPNNPWALDPNSPATETTFRSILQNLTALRIDADWSTKKDIADLDNVLLTPSAIPVLAVNPSSLSPAACRARTPPARALPSRTPGAAP